MAKKLTVILLSGLLSNFLLFLPALAQTASRQETKIDKTREKIKKFDANKKVKVRLYSGTRYEGKIASAGEEEFVLIDKSSNRNTLRYADVDSIGGRGLPLGAKIAIGALAALGAAVLIVGIGVATSDAP